MYVIKWTILSRQCQYCPDGFNTIRAISKLSGQFQNCLDSFKLSRQFQNCPDNFKTVRTVLKLSGRFLKCLDYFKTVWTISKLPGWFLTYQDYFKTVRTITKLSGWFQTCPDNFKTVQTVSSCWMPLSNCFVLILPSHLLTMVAQYIQCQKTRKVLIVHCLFLFCVNRDILLHKIVSREDFTFFFGMSQAMFTLFVDMS